MSHQVLTQELSEILATHCSQSQSRRINKDLEYLIAEYPNVKFVKIDVDQNTKHAQEVGIRSVPTIIVIKNKEVVHRSSGVNSVSYYKEVLNK